MAPSTYTIAGHAITPPPLEPALYLVATPIGNLRDISLRALETLAACDLLACEDTRVTRNLLTRYAITRTPVTYHEHNAETAGPKLLDALAKGQSVALASDAGTPLVSDPGYRLVVEAREAGHPVVAIPGASAVLTALSVSGLPTDDFRFVGFLPAKDKARRTELDQLKHIQSTLIAFESPHRLMRTLDAVSDIMGPDRSICVARELTKRFETIRTGPAADLVTLFADAPVKGEIVLLIAPARQETEPASEEDVQSLLNVLLADMPAAKAAKEAARRTGLPRADLYQRLLAMKNPDG